MDYDEPEKRNTQGQLEKIAGRKRKDMLHMSVNKWASTVIEFHYKLRIRKMNKQNE